MVDDLSLKWIKHQRFKIPNLKMVDEKVDLPKTQ